MCLWGCEVSRFYIPTIWKGGGLESCSADTKDKPTTYDQTANRQVKTEDSQGKFFGENRNE